MAGPVSRHSPVSPPPHADLDLIGEGLSTPAEQAGSPGLRTTRAVRGILSELQTKQGYSSALFGRTLSFQANVMEYPSAASSSGASEEESSSTAFSRQVAEIHSITRALTESGRALSRVEQAESVILCTFGG